MRGQAQTRKTHAQLEVAIVSLDGCRGIVRAGAENVSDLRLLAAGILCLGGEHPDVPRVDFFRQ